jgi:hypothetical protein
LDYFLQVNEFAQDLLKILLEEMREVFQGVEDFFELQELRAFNASTYQRFVDQPDRVVRILSRFSENKLPEFFSDFSRKVSEPSLRYMDGSNAPFLITRTLFLTTKLISESRYPSAIELPRQRLRLPE